MNGRMNEWQKWFVYIKVKQRALWSVDEEDTKKMRRRLFLLFSSKIINIIVNSRAAVKLNVTTAFNSFGPLYWHHRLFGTLYSQSLRNCMKKTTKKQLSMELSRLKTLISFHPNALWNSVSSPPPQSHLQYGECFVIVIRPCRLLSQVM